jgi:hypothetical protein
VKSDEKRKGKKRKRKRKEHQNKQTILAILPSKIQL